MDSYVLFYTPLMHQPDLVRAASERKDDFTRFDAAFAQGALPGEYDEAQWRLFGLWAQMRLCLGWDGGHDLDENRLSVVRTVLDRLPNWTADEVRRLWSAADGLMTWRHTDYTELYRLPLAATAQLSYPERRDVLNWRQKWFAQYWKPAWEVLREPLHELLTEPETDDPAATVRNIMWSDDPFATRMIATHAVRLAAPEVLPLLRLWNTATASRPSDKWTKRAADLLTPQAVPLVREILQQVAA